MLEIVLTALISSGCGEQQPDVTALWLGQDEIPAVLADKLNDALSPSIKDINNDGVKKIAFRTSELPWKNFFILYSGEVQVVILDINDFIGYAKDDTFLSVEDLLPKEFPDGDTGGEISMKTEHDSTEHIYGISLEGNKLFSDLGLDMKSMYIAINGGGRDSEARQNGVEIIKTLLQKR